MRQRSHDGADADEARTDDVIEAAYRRGAQQSLAMGLAEPLPASVGRVEFLAVLAEVVREMRLRPRAVPFFMHQAIRVARKRLRIPAEPEEQGPCISS